MRGFLLFFSLLICSVVGAQQPTVSSFTPTAAGTGTSITITGTNFTGVTGVTFGGAAAASFTVLSSTTLVAVVGSGSTGSLTITAAGGDVAIPGFTFIYGVPTIASFTPLSATIGETITITGTNLESTTQVNFGYTTAASFHVFSSTTITAVVGSGTSGNLSITTAGGIVAVPGFIFDTPPGPIVSSFSPTAVGYGVSVTITGANFLGTTAVTFGGIPALSFTLLSPTTLLATVGGGASGNVSVTTIGGTNALSGFTYNITIPPTITAFTPLSATIGETITITGTNLTTVNTVSLGGISAASFRVLSSTTITAVVGSGASGSLSLTTSDGTAVAMSGFIFNTPPPPVIASFSPTAAVSGMMITITGSNFLGTTAVSFGGTPAGSFTVLSSTTLVASVGAGSGGNVSVTTGGGTVAISGFTYVVLVPPAISSFSPFTGTTGSIITIIGSDFSAVHSVYFGGTAAASFTVLSPTTLIATVSNGSTGNISVVNSAGSAGMAGFIYTLPLPTITSFTPVSATIGTTVTITGTNFSGVTAVDFGGTAAASFNVLSPTLMTAIVAAGSSGSISITTVGGTGGKTGFIYISPLTIASFTPISGTTGTAVTINGTNFTGVSSVSFGGTAAASFTVLSSTEIKAVVSSGSTGSISITTGNGTATRAGFVYFDNPPTISSFTPLSATSGSIITITGTNFSGTTNVTFGGTPATAFTVVSSSTIFAVVGTSSTGSVSVSASGSTALLPGFVLITPPAIADVHPLTGVAGSLITITGSGFNTSTSSNIIFFGATKATVTAATANTLTVTVPVAASYGPITVLNAATFLSAASQQNFIPVFADSKATINANDFDAKVDLPSGGQNPTEALTGDLDGDGKPDLIVINSDFSNFAVFLNNSTGSNISFANPVIITSTTNPFLGAIGDIDGDGKPDIALVELNSNKIHVLLNKSTPGNLNLGPTSFTWPGAVSACTGNVFVATGDRPTSIIIQDIDGDGKPDLTVTNTNSNTVSVHLNTGIRGGQLSFGNPLNLTTAPSTLPVYVRATDLDKDGKTDLLIGYQQTNTNFSYYRNTSSSGTVSFSARVDIALGIIIPSNMGIATGDLDEDGKPDVTVADYTGHNMTILRNTSTPGNISFAPKISFPASSPSYTFALTDINGDGKPDIAVADKDDNTVSILRNISTTGAIGFSSAFTLVAAGNPAAVASADFNGDGRPDLAVTNRFEGLNTFSIFKNTTNIASITSFSPTAAGQNAVITITGKNLATTTTVSFGGTAAFSFQVINDNTLTASVANGSSGIVNVTTAHGNGNLAGFSFIGPPTITSFTPLSGTSGTTITINGTNLSTLSSVLFGGTAAISFTVVSSTMATAVVGTGTSGSISITSIGGTAGMSGFTFIVPPIPTITSFNPMSATSGSIITITGNNLFAATGVSFGGTPALSFTATSATSLVAIVGTGSTGSISITTSGGSGSLAGFVLIIPPAIGNVFPLTGVAGSSITITGSGFNTSTSSNIVFFGATKATVTAATANTLTVTVPVAASYGPITVLNAATFLSAASQQNFIPVFADSKAIINANDFDAKVDLPSGGQNPTEALTGDLDGDGKPDLIVINSDRSNFAVFLNNSTGSNISFANPVIINSTTNPFLGAIGDIDGDGKPDIALVELNSNKIHVLLNKSTPGNLNLGPASFTWPGATGTCTGNMYVATGDRPISVIIQDIDGDGKPDLTVTNTNSNTVSVHLNTGIRGGQLSFATAFNLTTNPNSLPVYVRATDLDKDGKPDLVIGYQQSNTNFSFYRNTSSSGTVSFSARVDIALGITIPSNMGIATGDLDDDGKPDVAIADYTGNNLTILRNTSTLGSISFAPKISFAVNSPGYTFTISDINGDGKPDIALADMNSNTVSILRNISTTGTIGFSSAFTLVAAGNPATVASADFNGDGRPDLAVTNRSEGLNTFSIFKNTTNIASITSFSPTAAGQNAVITITGKNLATTTTVSFGGTAAFSFQVINDNTLTARLANGSSGIVNVTTAHGNGNLAGFSFIGPPTITSFTPTTGGTGTIVTITGNNLSSATSVNFGGTAAASFSAFSSTMISAVVGAGSSGNLSITTLGGSIALSGFVYIPAPTVVSFSPLSARIGDLVTILGTNLTNTTDVSFGGTAAASFTVLSSTMITATVATGSSGSISLTTIGGKTGKTGFTYIPIPPVITSFLPMSATAGSIITIKGTDLLTTMSVSLGGISATSFTIVSSTTLTAVVGNGATGMVSLTTTGGSATLAGFTYIDPVPIISSFTPLSATTGQTVTITGANLSGITALTFGGTAAASFNVLSSTTVTAVVAAGSSGSISITTAGGTTALSGFTYIAPPTIAGFTPLSAATGQTVTITGANLSGITALTFGGTAAASFNVLSSTTVTAVVAAGSSGSISITTAGGTTALSGFTYIATPVISGFTPLSATTGQTVTITGANLSGITALTFGGTAAASFTVLSSTTVTAVVAAGSSGSISITTAGGATGLPGFTYITPPTISGFTPLSAATGQTVTITGANLSGITALTFGGTAVASFTVLSSTTVTAVVAAGSSGSISITTAGGTTALSGFTYIAPPMISGFTPLSATTGQTVTITGANLSGITALTFGGTAAASFTVLSSTTVTAIVATGSSGSISITTAGGTTALSGFTYKVPLPVPTIISFAPLSAATGETVTITGTNLLGVTALTFGGTAAAAFTVYSSTTILAVVGAGSSGSISVSSAGGTAALSGFSFSTSSGCGDVLGFTPELNNIGTDNILCFKNSYTLSLFNSTTDYPIYRWSTGETTKELLVNKNTTVSLQVGTTEACLSKPSIPLRMVKNLNPIPVLTQSADAKQLISSIAPNYRWYLNNKLIADEVASIYTPSKIGFYKVETSDDKTCWDASNELPIVILSIPLANEEIKVNSYPNPATGGTFTVVASFKRATNVVVRITVTNASGAVLLQTNKFIFFGKEIKVPLTVNAKGTVFVKMDINGDVQTQTVVIP